MTQHNNNETYKLLELSEGSESDLELPELITTPKKKRVKRYVSRTYFGVHKIKMFWCTEN